MATFGNDSHGQAGSTKALGQTPRRASGSVVGHASEIILTLPDLRPARAAAPVAPPINEELAQGWQVHRSHAAEALELPDEPAASAVTEHTTNSHDRPQLWRYDEADTNQPPVSHEAWKLAMRRLVTKRKKIASLEHRQLWYIGLATIAATVAALLGFSTVNEPQQFGLPPVPDAAPAFSSPIPITTTPAQPLRTTSTPSAPPKAAQIERAVPTLGQPNFAPRAAQQKLGDPKDVPPWDSWPAQDKFMMPPAASNSAASNDPPGAPTAPTIPTFPSQSPIDPQLAEGIGAAPLALSTAAPTPLPPVANQPAMTLPTDAPIQAKARLKGLIQKTTTRPANDTVGPGLH